jgi:membrane protease subunit (stomatin/prohibitin family)
LGIFDSLKNRLSTNLKFTSLSLMTNQQEILNLCRSLTPVERADIVKNIESHFQWQSVAQFAQAMYPAYYSGGVSEEALDMVKSGQVAGGVELMRWQNQGAMQANWGMMPAQNAALGFAWMVLKAMDQHQSSGNAFCTSCGARRSDNRFCTNCGAAFF